MKILVTGGAGFIGSHLVRQLMEAGDDVVSLDNLSTGLRDNLPEGARLEVMDTHDDKAEDLFRQEHFDAVVHLAAQTLVSDSMVDPENDMYQNIAGTVHIMECCRKYGVKRVIFSSSAATYGDVDEKALPVQETLPQIPLSFYGLTKMTVEKYLALYHMAFGIHYVVLRFSNVYGERQGDGGEGGVISIFAKRLAKGQDITIFGNGKQTRLECYAKTGQGWDKNLDSLCSILESELKTLDATFRFHTGGSLMKYTKKERMNIGRQIYEDQINKYEAAGKYGISAQTAREYMRMYRNTNHLPPKTSKPRDYGLAKAKVIPEAAKLDEYQKMSKEDLISALIDARIREERLKLGYEVVEEDDSKKKLITYVKKTAK